jgi:hypothetical protein
MNLYSYYVGGWRRSAGIWGLQLKEIKENV